MKVKAYLDSQTFIQKTVSCVLLILFSGNDFFDKCRINGTFVKILDNLFYYLLLPLCFITAILGKHVFWQMSLILFLILKLVILYTSEIVLDEE